MMHEGIWRSVKAVPWQDQKMLEGIHSAKLLGQVFPNPKISPQKNKRELKSFVGV